MLQSTHQTLPDLLVRLLGTHSAQRVDDLQAQLERLGKHYTVQAIYKELRRLQASGVVLSSKTRYSLDLTWIMHLERFVEVAKGIHLDSANAPTVLPPIGAKTRWSFSTLIKLDDFWVQIIWMMFLRSTEKVYYTWAPHPWYYFGQAEKLEQFYAALSAKGRLIHLVMGGRSPIDRFYASKVDPRLFKVLMAPDLFPDKRHQHFGVIGDFILVVTLEPPLARQIDAFFDETKSVEKLKYDRILRLLNTGTKATLQVENNPAKAVRMLKVFRELYSEDG